MIVEQMQKELEIMMQIIYKHENALRYMHHFVKLFIERYL